MTSVPLLDSPPHSRDPSGPTPTPTPISGRVVLLIAAALIAAQLVLRGWVAASGFFYWDDFLLIGRVSSQPVLSTELLFTSHDGHVMPLAFVLIWLVTEVAPLSWPAAVVVLTGLQLLASLAVLRLLVVLLGVRARLLGPLVFFLFVPLTVPAFAWWSAAVNALPLQIALAWVSADAVLLVRTGRRRYAASGAVVFAVALMFFEKSVVVLPVAFAAVVLTAYVTGGSARVAARRGGLLWTAAGAVLLAWSACFLFVIQRPRGLSAPEHPGTLWSRALSDGLVPALFGGPWRWERWQPATPWADAPSVLAVLSWLALILFAVWTMRTRRRVAAIWVCAAGYGVLTIAPVVILRDGPSTAGLLLQSVRYFADFAVVATVALALIALAPRRARSSSISRSNAHARQQVPTSVESTHTRTEGGSAAIEASRARRIVGISAIAAFLASSVYSTITFTRSWEPSPARTYVSGVRAALPGAADAPLLPQEVPWNVLNPLAFPENMTDRVFAPLATSTTFAHSTPRLRMITDDGAIVDARVWWNRAIVEGPEPRCGYRVPGTAGANLPLDGPMQIRDWTAQVNYNAARDGRIALSFEGETETIADVRAGLNTVYIRLLGGGDTLRIRSLEEGQSLCVGAGPVGVAAYER
ncbi:hypothetical protein [Nocardia alba]|uniref:hypothetical protein n=1 Tax=Nocardia alba TaxID=225051 RepID=UPI001FB36CB1|nr:hypothetical protein [Nocardia alba]